MTARFGPVEELKASHRLDAFDCGSEAQTVWLRDQALQSHAGGMSRVFVVRRLDDDRVVGFYALSAGSVLQANVSPRVVKGSGRHPVPVVVLSRLGSDVSEQGKGLGKALVIDALRRVAIIAEQVGVKALLIHCENERARDFYLHLAAFEPSPIDPLQLTLLMKDLKRALR